MKECLDAPWPAWCSWEQWRTVSSSRTVLCRRHSDKHPAVYKQTNKQTNKQTRSLWEQDNKRRTIQEMQDEIHQTIKWHFVVWNAKLDIIIIHCKKMSWAHIWSQLWVSLRLSLVLSGRLFQWSGCPCRISSVTLQAGLRFVSLTVINA